MTRCQICGRKGATTRDHIPPKRMFPNPRPSDLITVQSCRTCQFGHQLDEDYFATVLITKDDIAAHPAADPLLEKFYRDLRRPEAAKWRETLVASMEEVELVTEAGIYAGKAPSITLDRNRMERVGRKLARGLHFHVTGSRVPRTHEANAHFPQFLKPEAFEMESVRNVLGALDAAKREVVGDGWVFSYRYIDIPDTGPHPPPMAVLAMTFYGTFHCFASISPKNARS